ncbi:unnamed protein product [Leuciscus chuanchicus]
MDDTQTSRDEEFSPGCRFIMDDTQTSRDEEFYPGCSAVHQQRSEPEPSCVSMRSDASMGQPPYFKSEDTQTDLGVLIGCRAATAAAYHSASRDFAPSRVIARQNGGGLRKGSGAAYLIVISSVKLYASLDSERSRRRRNKRPASLGQRLKKPVIFTAFSLPCLLRYPAISAKVSFFAYFSVCSLLRRTYLKEHEAFVAKCLALPVALAEPRSVTETAM